MSDLNERFRKVVDKMVEKNPHLADIFYTRSLRMSGWDFEGPRSKKKFYYTTERDQATKKFYAVTYVFSKKRNAYVMKKKVVFAKRWKACDRAYKWYCQHKGYKFESLHHVSEAQKERGRKLQELKQASINA